MHFVGQKYSFLLCTNTLNCAIKTAAKSTVGLQLTSQGRIVRTKNTLEKQTYCIWVEFISLKQAERNLPTFA
jgi:hypothetical protein